MNDLRLLLERRGARNEALSAALKTPEFNVNHYRDLRRNQLIGCIKAQLRRIDAEIEIHKKYIRVQSHVMQ